MGFFQPAGSFSKFYIGMSYQQVYKQTIVWVTNRDEPVSDMFISVLKISDGNLVLFDGRYERDSSLVSTLPLLTRLFCSMTATSSSGTSTALFYGKASTIQVSRGFPEPISGTTNGPRRVLNGSRRGRVVKTRHQVCSLSS
ncbi:unnamed protein product [Brassica rapa]|uniref:Bulb-type lectin domain-containing protein n=1 Tax=Brassica campestris TaxID=3711 RepID=A0A3P5YLX6_BRACM|nr:unnamed protein product [Brassica rapa]VDC68747.1 unnamed protein product [Brassica rapa]